MTTAPADAADDTNCPMMMHEFIEYGNEGSSNDFIHRRCIKCGLTEYMIGKDFDNVKWEEFDKNKL